MCIVNVYCLLPRDSLVVLKLPLNSNQSCSYLLQHVLAHVLGTVLCWPNAIEGSGTMVRLKNT